MNRKINIILGLVCSVLAIVAVLFGFGYAFSDAIGDTYYEGLSLFQTIFGSTTYNHSPVGGLIAAFVLQLIAILTAVLAAATQSKLASIFYGVTAILLAVAAILFLNTMNFFNMANPGQSLPSDEQLGFGTVCTVIFSFIPAALCAYGAYSNFKS